jgi:hypothetical protein
MTDEPAAMRAWLDAHGLADAELLHHLVNQGPDGSELTDSERQLLSALLEVRRMVVPGYRPAPADQPTTQDQPGPAELLELFDPGTTRPPQRAVVEPADRHAQRPVRPTARHHGAPPLSARRLAHRGWEEERER